MNTLLRAAIAASLVVGVGFVAINVLPRQSDGSGVGGQPTASAFASPSPSASPPPSQAPAVGIPKLTETFVSAINGFSVQYPEDPAIEPATVVWNPGGIVDQNNANFDFVHTQQFGSFRGSSTEVPDGVGVDDWVDQTVVHWQPGSCGARRSEQLAVTIDGQPGRIWEGCPNEIEATVVVGERLYLFTLFGETGVSRAVFDAYASTIRLHPEDAAQAPSPTPS